MEMEFKDFKDKFVENFKEISKDVHHLFVVGVDKDEMGSIFRQFPRRYKIMSNRTT
jgi:hypothetical protein